MIKISSINSSNLLSFLDFLRGHSFNLIDVIPKIEFKSIKLSNKEISVKIIQRKNNIFICTNGLKLLANYNRVQS